MSAFLISAALLAAVALGVLLRPLRRTSGAAREALNVSVYRDQLRELEADRKAGTVSAEDYERSKAEIERRLLEDVSVPDKVKTPGGSRALIAGAIAAPLLAAAVYWAVGNPAAVTPPDQQIQDMVERLAAKMRSRPEDVEGWKLLGRSYAVMGRYDDSVKAFAQAAQRAPRDPQLLADFA
ncbi:MAG TPA: c-type cytochrome biogenesis protein CcmI, partial [Burkholderiales bacterium]|nr:c-type cytochrome biogenesis protein CcmI [Burkholderiales bacterium]